MFNFPNPAVANLAIKMPTQTTRTQTVYTFFKDATISQKSHFPLVYLKLNRIKFVATMETFTAGERRICQSKVKRTCLLHRFTCHLNCFDTCGFDQLKQTLRWSGERRPFLRYYGTVCIYEHQVIRQHANHKYKVILQAVECFNVQLFQESSSRQV